VKKHIIIVGGGYAGANLAHALDRVARVTLVEPREAFVHNVAAIRSVIFPELLDRIIIPYDRLLSEGDVIRARAGRIEEGGVLLEDGRRIDGDIVIAATGSSYAQPFKPNTDDMAGFRTRQAALHDAVLGAGTIAIVGAGPVGVELAAEIAAHHPGKTVTLFAGSDAVVPGVSEKLSRRLHGQIAQLGIEMRLGVMTEGLQSTDAPFSGSFEVSGKRVSADLVIPVFGARPVLPPLEGDQAQPGRLQVDPWMRPGGTRTLFAFGDAADNGDPMTIIAVRRQMGWLLKALKALLSGADVETVAPYRPADKPFLLVPLGPNSGSSIFPLSRGGWLTGPRLTQKLKGRDLFIEKTRKELGY